MANKNKYTKANPFRETYIPLMEDCELDGRPVIFFDLETTGTDPEKDEIIQIGAVKTHVINGQFVIDEGPGAKLNRYVHPKHPIPKAASDVNGIYDEDVEDSPFFDELEDELMEFFAGDPILAGYNIHSFDIPMLETHLFNAGWSFDWSGEFDVMYLGMDCLDIGNEVGDYKLVTMTRYFDNDFDKNCAHDAYYDVMCTITVANNCIRLFSMKEFPGGTARTKIYGAQYWHPAGSVWKVRKIYVRTANGRLEYDCPKRAWVDNGAFAIVDAAKLVEDLIKFLNTENGVHLTSMFEVEKFLRDKERAANSKDKDKDEAADR